MTNQELLDYTIDKDGKELLTEPSANGCCFIPSSASWVKQHFQPTGGITIDPILKVQLQLSACLEILPGGK